MVKIELKYDEVEDRYYGKYLKFKQAKDNLYLIISGEELIGHIEKIRVGSWMQWCILLEDGCYLSPGCTDEAREMQRILGGMKLHKNTEKQNEKL